MAYSKQMPDRKCQSCLSKATHEVFNHYNASHGYFCKRCADREVRRIAGEEKRLNALIEEEMR